MNIHGHIIDFIVAIALMFLGTLLYFGQKQDLKEKIHDELRQKREELSLPR